MLLVEPYRTVPDPYRADYKLLKKPPRREKGRRLPVRKLRSRWGFVSVKVSVWPDECQGIVEDGEGHPLDIVETPQPGMTYRILHAYCRHESLIPAATELHLWKMAPRRKKMARRAHAWFLAKFRRWMRYAA